MTLLVAHRILIGTAIAFFVLYGFWEFTAPTGRVWRGALALAAALGLAIYFRTIGRDGPPAPRGGER